LLFCFVSKPMCAACTECTSLSIRTWRPRVFALPALWCLPVCVLVLVPACVFTTIVRWPSTNHPTDRTTHVRACRLLTIGYGDQGSFYQAASHENVTEEQCLCVLLRVLGVRFPCGTSAASCLLVAAGRQAFSCACWVRAFPAPPFAQAY
jgi:hypothetical protein